MNYSVFMKQILDNPEKYPHIKTVDDFFNATNIPMENRSDFLISSILNGVNRLENKPSITFEEYCKIHNIDFSFMKNGNI